MDYFSIAATMRLTLALSLCLLAHGAIAQQARFIHAAPFADHGSDTTIELQINGQPVLSNQAYGTYSGNILLGIGEYEFSVRRGSDGSQLVSRMLSVENSGRHWVYLIGNGDDEPFELVKLHSTVPLIGGGDVPAFIVNAALQDDLGPLLMRKADGAIPGASPGGLSPVDFGDVQFLLLRSGVRDYKFTTPDGEVNKLDLAPLTLSPPTIGDMLQLVIIGDGLRQPLQLLAVPGGILRLVDPVDLSALGWWHTPNTGSAEGLVTEPIPSENRMAGIIASYAENGSGDQAWFVFDGPMSGRKVTADVYRSHGGQLGGDQASVLDAVGILELRFDDCLRGSGVLHLDDGTSASWELARLTMTVPCDWAP